MSSADTLVTVGIPVRNGVPTLEAAVRSVLTQDHDRLEVVISDNASTDDTETLCRDLAASDSRIVYHRQPTNVGILNNFVHTMRVARGTYFQWLGDDDSLTPAYVSRCLEAFAEDTRLILVTTEINYSRPDGTTHTRPFTGTALRSNDPIERFAAITAYLADGMAIDPLYGLIRRAAVASIARRNMIREDEVFTTKLALAGPWGHVPDVLLHRHLKCAPVPVLAQRLGVPLWQAYVPTALQCREILRWISEGDLTPAQRRRARAAVARLYRRRQYLKVTRNLKKLVRVGRAALA